MRRSNERGQETRRWVPITLVNVVVTGSTRCSLDLHNLSKKLMNAEYFPKKFAALKLCRTRPFAKALVFRSGKIVCVGATSIERAYDSLNWFVDRIRTVEGEHVQVYEKTIQNMVATSSLKDPSKSVNLQRVFDNCPQHCQFEPQVFFNPPRYTHTHTHIYKPLLRYVCVCVCVCSVNCSQDCRSDRIWRNSQY